MDVTDEMRQAVYEADCAQRGHMFTLENLLQSASSPDARTIQVLAGPDTNTLPHVSCRRCPKVWLVIDDPGSGYTDAVAKLRSRGAPAALAKPQPHPEVLRGPEVKR